MDGARLLLGHATRSPRWDIPKGVAEAGESHAAAAVRELREETGLLAASDALADLGRHVYLPGKDLALFAWRVADMPDPAALRCTAMVALEGGRTMPELDRFGVFAWPAAVTMVGRNMARVLAAVERLVLAPDPPASSEPSAGGPG